MIATPVPKSTRFLFVFITATCLGQCSCNNPKDTHRPQTAPVNYTCQGIITATSNRFISPGDDPYEQFDFLAMFPRYRTEDRMVVESMLDTHVPQLDLTMDSCSDPEPILSMRRKNPRQKQFITLVDAGDLTITHAGHKTAVTTQTFPDLLKVIDGVMYTTNPRSSGISFKPGQTYTLTTRGTDQIGPFEVVLDAPASLENLSINNVVPQTAVPVIHQGKPITLSWNAGGWGDEIIAHMEWNDMGLKWSIDCRMKDDGHFTVPAEMTRRMAPTPEGSTHEMILSRVRQSSFAANGLSLGDFSFVAATRFLVQFDSGE